MIRVRTFNSVYELDHETGDGGIPLGGRIRIVESGNDPTECLSPLGEWKSFHAISVLAQDYPMQIIWPPDAPHTATITSVITAIEEI